MAPGAERFLEGLPVPVDPEAIEHELVRLWKPDVSAKDSPSVTRVCLSNLIVHLPDEAARQAASRLLPAIARRHPSRIFVLAHRARGAGDPGLSASIAAICHRPEPGGASVCCEEIILEAPPGDEGQFPGAVLPLLVPDVPTTLVAIFPGGKRLVGSLSGFAERIVVDSRRDGGDVLASLASSFGRPGVAVGDLAWEATLPWRRVFADLFDEPEVRALAASLLRMEAAYRPGDEPGE
ncbi:MAG: glucose-6-phosphate dehydrogenase assembly protein OpcA, partial [Planctomycetota bacterium]